MLFNNIELQEYEQETILASTEKAIITDINLTPSLDNPWSELKVIEPLGAQYQITSESYDIHLPLLKNYMVPNITNIY